MSDPRTNTVTKVFKLDHEDEWERGLCMAANALQQGELVAFPTETVYGLGADALNSRAVERIFAAKGRPADNPLIVHVAEIEAVRPLVRSTPPVFYQLAQVFWPGPLTMVLPRSSIVPDVTTGGLDSVAVRLPMHPVALELLRKSGVPIAAPSANCSGRPSPTLAQHVIADLDGQIAVLLDGGSAGVGVESTVLDLTATIPTVLRPGGVTLEQLAQVIGNVTIDPRATALPGAEASGPVRSPGMKYRHYAPLSPAVMVEGEPPYIWEKLQNLIREEKPERPGLMLTQEGMRWFVQNGVPTGAIVEPLGSRLHPEEAARLLFAALRQLDQAQVDRIYIEGIPATGIGLAVMNRLRRAVGGRIVQVKP